MTSSAIVQKLWNYCNVLRDDGMSYLLARDAQAGAHKPASVVPDECSWPSLIKKDGDELFDHYRHLLEKLGNEKGLLGLIFNKSQNKFQDPAKLRRLIVDLIDKENWSVMSADVKGDAYEGLLEKNAQDVKTGAGQYFTPRPLIAGIVDVMAPRPGETVCDPACGTGGFILAAHDYVVNHYPHMTTDEKKKLKENTFKGIELVQGVARLCAMNLLLHVRWGQDGVKMSRWGQVRSWLLRHTMDRLKEEKRGHSDSSSSERTATKPVSTFSGSETKPSTNPTIFPTRTFWLKRSSKTSRPPWNNSAKSPPT